MCSSDLGGGSEPYWRKDGTELFYVAADRNLMAAPVRLGGATFEPGVPKPLFPLPAVSSLTQLHSYAVASDGRRFLVSKPVGETAAIPFTVVLDWQAGLKK